MFTTEARRTRRMSAALEHPTWNSNSAFTARTSGARSNAGWRGGGGHRTGAGALRAAAEQGEGEGLGLSPRRRVRFAPLPDRLERVPQLGGQSRGVVAAHVEPAAPGRAVGRERRDDGVPARAD